MAEVDKTPSSGKACWILLTVLVVVVIGACAVLALMPELFSLGAVRLVDRVAIAPQEAVLAGGQWRLVSQWESGGEQREAQNVYVVEFKSLPGWEAPAPVVLKKGAVPASIEGIYKPARYAEETILTLAGSSTLANRLVPELAENYLRHVGADEVRRLPGQNPDEFNVQGVFYSSKEIRTIRIEGFGTSHGFSALKDGACDLAMATQKLSPLDVRRIGEGVIAQGSENRLGMDAVAVVVNRGNTVPALTVEQVGKIFSGEITNWEQVGGPAGMIKVVALAPAFATRSFFEGAFMNGMPLGKSVREVDVHGMVSELVAQDQQAIGFCSITLAGQSREMPIKLRNDSEPLLPSPQNIRTLAYPASRSVYLYVRSDSMNVYARDFIRLSRDKAGQEIVSKYGFVNNADLPEEDSPSGTVERPGPAAPQGGEFETPAVLKAPPIAGPLPKLVQFDGEVVSDETRTEVLQGFADGIFGARHLPFVLRFEPGTIDLDQQADRELDHIIELMKAPANAGKVLVLVGFSDSAGTYASNLAVSMRRAEVVADALKKRGVQGVAVLAAGEEGAIEPNNSRAGRERNRRVELWLK